MVPRRPRWLQEVPKMYPRRTKMAHVGNSVGRAQRASERSERSERSVQELRGSFAIQNRSKRLPSGNTKINGASRSMSNQVYVGVVFDGFSLVFQAFFDLGGLKVPKTFQDAPKTRQDAPKTPPRRAKTPPKRSQDAPRRPKRCPGAPQDAPKSFKIHTYVENMENQKNLEKPMKNQ